MIGRLVVATSNTGKLREFAAALKGATGVVEPLPAGVSLPAETGGTFMANALQKAVCAAEATEMPALADDSGLSVDALGGAPGVRSARFAGPGATDADNCALLLERLRGVPETRRQARFIAALALVWPDGRTLTAVGECAGSILPAPRGSGGFGYDPLFYYPPLRRTFAELTLEQKNRVSHRAAALAQLRDRLSAASGRVL